MILIRLQGEGNRLRTILLSQSFIFKFEFVVKPRKFKASQKDSNIPEVNTDISINQLPDLVNNPVDLRVLTLELDYQWSMVINV
jgi:hypothetical protein